MGVILDISGIVLDFMFATGIYTYAICLFYRYRCIIRSFGEGGVGNVTHMYELGLWTTHMRNFRLDLQCSLIKFECF